MLPLPAFAINIYKIGLPFEQTLASDQLCSLLIAFPNEKKLFVFPDSAVFDNVSTAITIMADMLNGHVSLSFFFNPTVVL